MNEPASASRRLTTRRLLARAAILFEALWPALWPPLGLIGLYFCAALIGLPQMLPALPHLLLLVAVAFAALWAGWQGLRGVRIPDGRSADRRLETRSGLAHRPLAVLSDRPAGGDPIG